MWQDIVNGLYEMLGGIMLWNNVRILYNQKKVKGVSVMTTAFFTTWGIWNLYYYPFLDQWWSFLGGLVIVFANVVWVSLAVKYRNNK